MHATPETSAAAIPRASSKAGRLEAIKAVSAAAEPQGASPELVAEAADTPPRVIPSIAGDRYKLEEYEGSRWRVITAAGTRPEDFDWPNREPWQYARHDVKMYDTVGAVCQDATWWAEYMVVCSVPGHVACKLLRSIAIPKVDVGAEAQIPKGYRIREAGPHEDIGTWISERIEGQARMNAGHTHRTHTECLLHLVSHPAFRKE